MKKFPISRYNKKSKQWKFVKEINGEYEDALKEAGKLQTENSGFQYRIWDCR
jgi:hypothetical protein